jgi:rhodanese-related sulfurtransferase
MEVAAGSFKLEHPAFPAYDDLARERRLPGVEPSTETVSVQALLPNFHGGSMDTVSMKSLSLYSLVGSPRCALVLDVRRAAPFEADPHLIPGALRPDADLVEFAARHAQGRQVVVYCVRGHEVGVDARNVLSAAGHDAVFLEGGIEAWRAAGLPTIRRRDEWRVPGGSRWITRSRPKIDRIACPWLIRRFIDPLARFDYVPTEKVFEEAVTRKAVAYDIAGAPVTHRGEQCSFDALLEEFALRDPALDLLATIVRGADTDRLDLAPQSAGLLAASLGLSRRYSDDHEMLEQAMPIYDGLLAWCREETQGRSERHDWTPGA